MRTTRNNLYNALFLVLFTSLASFTSLGAVSAAFDNSIDSLQQLIDTETVDSLKFKLYTHLVRELSQVDRSSAIEPLREQLQLARKLDDPVKVANTAHTIGTQYIYLGKTDSAYHYEMITKGLIDEINDPLMVSAHLNTLALIFQRENKYEEAIEAYQDLIVLGDSIADYVGNIYAYINMMSLFMDLDDEAQALKYVEDIEEIKTKFPDMSKGEVDEIQGLFSAIYLNVGLCYTSLNQLDTAEVYYNEAYRCLEYIKDDYLKTYYKGYIDNSIGDNYYKKHELNLQNIEQSSPLDQALSFYSNANTSFSDLSENRGITFTLNNLGKTLNELKRPKEAKEKLLKALELGKEIDFREQIRDSYEYLAYNAEQLNDFQNANLYLREHVEYRDSIRNEERDEMTRVAEVKFETAQQKRAIELLNKENEVQSKQQTIQRYIYIISLLLLLGIAYAVFARLRYNKQKEISDYQQEMNQAMSRFVPMGFIKALGKDKITEVKLGDQIEADVTVVFTDIRSFTTLSEGMTPTENFAFVKEYAERMGPIIEKHGGFISQYLGDGIMAIFKNEAKNALDACIEMQQDITKYNALLTDRGSLKIKVGMGLHSGPLVMGIIGDESRWDATLISDTVNTAARIESSTKQFSSPILLSEDSVGKIENIKPYNLKQMGELSVKGKTKLVSVYECDHTLVKKISKSEVSDFA